MDIINGEIILNVWLAMLIYNIILRALGTVIMNAIMRGKTGDEIKKTFKERLEQEKNK